MAQKTTFSIFFLQIFSYLIARSMTYNLESLINEYDNCINVVYVYNSKNTSIGASTAPLIISSDLGFDIDWRKPHTKRLRCANNFFLYPERHDKLRGDYKKYNNQSLYWAVNRNLRDNVKTLLHIITNDLNDTMGKIKQPDSRAQPIIHVISPRADEGDSRIHATLMVFKDLNHTLRYREFYYNDVEGWRTGLKNIAKEDGRNSYCFPSNEHSNPNASKSMSQMISKFLGVPSTYKFELKWRGPDEGFLTVLRFLTAQMLDIQVGSGISDVNILRYAQRWTAGDPPMTRFYMNFGAIINLHLPEDIKKENLMHVVPSGEKFMNFVTCDGVRSPLSFYFYTSPYDAFSWFTYAILTFLIIPAVVILTEVSQLDSLIEFCKFWTYLLSYNISVALEVSPTFPRSYSLRGMSRLVLGMWLGLTLVLVNAYKGIASSELTAPQPVGQQWTSVEQMDAFVFMRTPEFDRQLVRDRLSSFDYILGMRFHFCFPDDHDFVVNFCKMLAFGPGGNKLKSWDAILNTLRRRGMSADWLPKAEHYCKGSNITKQLRQIQSNSSRKNGMDKASTLKSLGWTNIILAMHSCDSPTYFIQRPENSTRKPGSLPFVNAALVPVTTPPEEIHTFVEEKVQDILKFLASCDHNGYIDHEERLDAFIAYSQAWEFPIYRKGNDKLFPHVQGYMIRHEHTLSKENYNAFQALLASGIYHVWDKWYRINHPSAEEKMIANRTKLQRGIVKLKPLNITSNIVTAFAIFGAAIALSSLSLSIEFAWRIAEKIGKELKILKSLKMYKN